MKLPPALRAAVLTWAAFVLLDFLAGTVFPAWQTEAANARIWSLAANAIVAITFALIASWSRWRGLKLAVAMSIVSFGIGLVNIVEGMVYLKPVLSQSVGLIAFLAAKHAIMIPIWRATFSGPDIGFAPATPASRHGGGAWR